MLTVCLSDKFCNTRFSGKPRFVSSISLGTLYPRWLGSRVVSVLDSGTEGLGCVTVLGKLLTPIVPLFIKQQN